MYELLGQLCDYLLPKKYSAPTRWSVREFISHTQNVGRISRGSQL